MAKHYVKLNEKGEVVKGFSDELELPEIGDILINEEGRRHFELDGEPVQSFKDGDVHIYLYKNGEVKRKTDKAIQKEQEAIDSAKLLEPTEVEKLNIALLEMGEMVAEINEKIGG